MRRRVAASVGLATALLLVFFIPPVVPYAVSVNIPGAYSQATFDACTKQARVNETNHQDFSLQRCLLENPLPPAVLKGSASLAFRAIGIGLPPFHSVMSIKQGFQSALVYFDGATPVAAQEFSFPNASTGLSAGPPGVVNFESASISSGEFGEVNFTATIDNLGKTAIASPVVFLSAQGYSQNSTFGGLTWIGLAGLPYGCSYEIKPGGRCLTSSLLNWGPNPSNTTAFYVEVVGLVNSSYFLWKQRFVSPTPQEGLGSQWVGRLVSAVNQSRSGGLVENATLDSFAAKRFATAVTNPDVSDYGLQGDVSSYFGIVPPGSLEEVLLYPGNYSAAAYASYLQEYAPGHWSALTSSSFTQYGYYLGVGPYEVVQQPCPVSEIPQAGVNITRYFQGAGCGVTVQQTTWLVVILGK